jgi:hypothetical protein
MPQPLKTRAAVPTEEQCVRIHFIDVYDSLGYRGAGREEHSGENAPVDPLDLLDELADNAPRQLARPAREH